MVVRAMVRAMVVAVRAKVVAAPSLPPEVHQAHPPVRVALGGHEGQRDARHVEKDQVRVEAVQERLDTCAKKD